jgi:hypothetical protein
MRRGRQAEKSVFCGSWLPSGISSVQFQTVPAELPREMSGWRTPHGAHLAQPTQESDVARSVPVTPVAVGGKGTGAIGSKEYWIGLYNNGPSPRFGG